MWFNTYETNLETNQFAKADVTPTTMPGQSVDLSFHTLRRDRLLSELSTLKLFPDYVTLKSEARTYIIVSFHPDTTRDLLLGEYDHSRPLKDIPSNQIDINPNSTLAHVIGSIMGHIAEHVFDKGFKKGRQHAHKSIIKKLGIDDL